MRLLQGVSRRRMPTKKIYASRSHQFNLNDPKFREIFPELCVPECVPVEILYPINKPSSSSSDNTTTAGNETNKEQVPQVVRLNEANQQGLLMGGINQRRPNRNENPLRGIVAGGNHVAHAENANNNSARANGSNNNQQGNINNNNNNNVVGQRGILDQWRKWIIVSLVCLYLVMTKLLARSTVSGSPGGEPST